MAGLPRTAPFMPTVLGSGPLVFLSITTNGFQTPIPEKADNNPHVFPPLAQVGI